MGKSGMRDSRWRKQKEPKPQSGHKPGVWGIGRNGSVAGVARVRMRVKRDEFGERDRSQIS